MGRVLELMDLLTLFLGFNNKLAGSYEDSVYDPNLVEKARKLVLLNPTCIHGVGDVFAIFSAFNYLNFAVKQNKNIGYGFKSKLENFALYVFHKYTGIDLYVDNDNGIPILFVSIYGFVFSFHSVSFKNLSFKSALERETPIYFDGIRKQEHASRIFSYALDKREAINNLNMNSSNNRGSYRQSEPNDSRESPSKKPHSSSYNGNLNVNVDLYNINDIIRDFHLDFLCTTKETRNNIAIVISTLYLYKDIVSSSSPQLPLEIQKGLLRDIIIHSYSVIECIELEVGAKLKGERRNSGSTRKESQQLDSEYLKAFKNHFSMSGDTKTFYDQYRIDRNNVHLSKNQNIYDDDVYSTKTVEKYIRFLMNYLDFLYHNF